MNNTFKFSYTKKTSDSYSKLEKKLRSADTRIANALESLISNDSTILDYGCGTGRLIPILLKNHPRKIVASDPSRAMIQMARKRYENASNVSLHRTTSEKLPFPNKCFDLIVCHFVFHYIENLDVVLCEFRRILKPRGRIIATFSDVKTSDKRLENTMLPMMFDKKMQVKSYLKTGAQIRQNMKKCGFRIEKYELISKTSIATVPTSYPHKKKIELRTALLVAHPSHT